MIFFCCSYAFALEETNEWQKAEQLLKKVLAMNPAVPWAHHAMCKRERELAINYSDNFFLLHAFEAANIGKDPDLHCM